MTHHFRTLTAVVRIDDDSNLRHPGSAMGTAWQALTAAGFTVKEMRTAHNDTGWLPLCRKETR